jgi:hypothetical protein
MARLKYLDDWAKAVLEVPRDSFELLFGRDDVVRHSIESMPFYSRYRPGFRRMEDVNLIRLHAHARGLRREVEYGLWTTLLSQLEHAIPDEVANDLIDRDIAVNWLGHTRQSDAVMQRLCPLVHEARLTMAREIYTQPNHTLDEFLQVLEAQPNDWGLMNLLSHARSSSPEKRAAFERLVEEHPQRERFLPLPDDDSPLYEQVASPWEIARPLNASTAPRLGFYFPDENLRLARDPETPFEVLEDLSTIREVEDAAAIRHAARINLRENHNEVES